MEILDLLEERYNKDEYVEIAKLISIQKNNTETIKNFKKIIELQNRTIISTKILLNNEVNNIEKLNDRFYENNKMFMHILENMTTCI